MPAQQETDPGSVYREDTYCHRDTGALPKNPHSHWSFSVRKTLPCSCPLLSTLAPVHCPCPCLCLLPLPPTSTPVCCPRPPPLSLQRLGRTPRLPLLQSSLLLPQNLSWTEMHECLCLSCVCACLQGRDESPVLSSLPSPALSHFLEEGGPSKLGVNYPRL